MEILRKIREKIWFGLVLATIFLAGSTLSAQAATMYFSPSSGTYSSGRNFVVSVIVDSADQAMNAAEGVINFPTDKLQVVGISKAGSVFNLWVQEPSFSNSGATGNVRFEGVVLNPGFTGRGAKILDITFRTNSQGTANVPFASGSVLANDGEGTNILSSLGSATFSIQAGSVPPASPVSSGLPPKPVVKHFIKKPPANELVLFNTSEDPTKWTNGSFSQMAWVVPSETSGVTTILDERSETALPSKTDGVFDSRTFNFLEEGRHYFHIRFTNSRGAGPTLHYPLFIDLTPPKPFQVTVLNGDSGAKPMLSFSTVDDLSGVDHYEIKSGDEDWVKADNYLTGVSTYTLSRQKPGSRVITVKAIDKAGNFTEAKVQLNIVSVEAPIIEYYPKHLTSPGEKLVIRGTALPSANIEIRLYKGSKDPIILSTKADDKGNWSLIYGEAIPSGSYKLTAKQILENGSESPETDPVYMSVNSLFWKLFLWLFNIGGFIILLLIVIAAASLIIYYYWHKLKTIRRKIRKQAREAEEALVHGVAAVRKELEKGEARQKISKDLGDIKKEVEDDIDRIERL